MALVYRLLSVCQNKVWSAGCNSHHTKFGSSWVYSQRSSQKTHVAQVLMMIQQRHLEYLLRKVFACTCDVHDTVKHSVCVQQEQYQDNLITLWSYTTFNAGMLHISHLSQAAFSFITCCPVSRHGHGTSSRTLCLSITFKELRHRKTVMVIISTHTRLCNEEPIRSWGAMWMMSECSPRLS